MPDAVSAAAAAIAAGHTKLPARSAGV